MTDPPDTPAARSARAKASIQAAGGLLTAREVAAALGVTQQAFNARVRRAQASGRWTPDCPEPVAWRSDGKIPMWTRASISLRSDSPNSSGPDR